MVPEDLQRAKLKILTRLGQYCNGNKLLSYLIGEEIFRAVRYQPYFIWDDE